MKAIILTVAIALLIGGAFAAVVVKMIIDKKKGKHSCSCGGSCGACPVGCSCTATRDATKN